jgi:glycosyltransferase involved in cell wall biosynthesis
MAPMAETIVLGPEIDLHRGVHYSLAQSPPAGYRYEMRNARHTLLFPERVGSPFCAAQWGEFVSFGPGAEIAHTPRWPALGRTAWVTDTDDFGYPVFAGRYAVNAGCREAFRKPWIPAFRRHVICRARNMLTAYCHPSCRAVLFRSRFASEAALRWIAELGLNEFAALFTAKLRVLYPAQPATAVEEVSAKWTAPRPVRILFCGREFETKNGRMALEIFSRVARTAPWVEFTYIGSIPPQELDRHALPPTRFRHFSSLPRAEALAEFARSHILFHPSKFEGLGTVFVEAAAAGMAVVAAAGNGMEPSAELFGDGGALLLDRDRIPPSDEPAVFEQLLRGLLDDHAAAQSLAFRNYEAAAHGWLSLDARDALLIAVYREARAAESREPLRIGDLPHVQGCTAAEMSSEEIEEAERAFRAATGLAQRRFAI